MVYKLLFLSIFFPILCFAEIPFEMPPVSQLQKIRGGIMETTKGTIYFKLFTQDAPYHVANLKYLADRNYYSNKAFHIFKKHYLAQTGALNNNPASGLNYSLPPEFNSHKHLKGSLSMVRRPDYLDISRTRNSHSAQFRIMLTDSPHMDGQFTVFGQIIKGFEVLDSLSGGDLIKSLKVYVRN